MSQPQAPRVKLPNITPSKTSQASSNSWAVKEAQTGEKTPTAAYRDKYENKPMPPTPGASPSPTAKVLTARRNRGYIQPAIPLSSPHPASSNMKNRAVTDPVMPKPLFMSTTNTVNQLRKKYSQSKNNGRSREDNENDSHRPKTPPQFLTHKASQILGVYPVNTHETPPASAPPSTYTPDFFRTSIDSKGGRQVSPNRQVHSTPVPTRRYLQENGMPVPTDLRMSEELKDLQDVEVAETDPSQTRTGSDGLLNTSRLGTCGRKGEVGIVNQNEMQRVPSFAGIIEQPDSPNDVEACMEPDAMKTGWSENTLRPQFSGEVLQPTVYTPSIYAGVWENDPHVGRTLPPFSPFPQQPFSESDQRTISQTSREIPIVLQRFPGESSHGSGYTHSIQSQNSWAPSGNGNYFAQSDPSSSGAGTTPRFSTHVRNNSVPPPPQPFPGFQPSGPLPPGLAQMEMNLHHHIESCFGSLMRMATNHADGIVDKIVRRVEYLQELVGRGLKGVRSEVKDVRKELASMRKELAELPQPPESFMDSLNSIVEKLGQLEIKVDNVRNGCQRVAAEVSESERGAPSSTCSQNKESPSKGSHSAHTSTSSRHEQQQPHLSSVGHPVASTHNSTTSSKSQRSNMAKVGGAGLRMSDEQSTKWGVSAETGSANAQVPNIRDHPAFRGVAESYGMSSPIYQTPDYSESWYQHAYGNRQQ